VTSGTVGLLAGAALLVAGGALGVRAYLRSRPSASELERRRRAMLHANGKMGDANLIELREGLMFYSYAVRGVEYHATQDVSELAHIIPADAWTSIGPVSVKYDARNPANSIVLCEQWSGLRVTQPRG
jgi:hypothetical protein